MTTKRPTRRTSSTTLAAIARAVNVFADLSFAERPRMKKFSQGSPCEDFIVGTGDMGVTRSSQYNLGDEDPAPDIKCHCWSTKT